MLTGWKATRLAGAAMLVAGEAWAQTAAAIPTDRAEQVAEADGITDIVVSGIRQQYRGDVPLRELPQSVQVLSAQKLSEAGVTRLDDALDFAGGVARQNNFGGLFDSFAIRGFAGDEQTSSSYLVNGFNASRGYSGIRDTSNAERVERYCQFNANRSPHVVFGR